MNIGVVTPYMQTIIHFQEWKSNNDLHHLPTRGIWFSWTNGRWGRTLTEKILDKVVSNHELFNIYTSTYWFNLLSNKFDQFHILLDFQLDNHPMKTQFKFMRMLSLNESCEAVMYEVLDTRVICFLIFIINKKLKVLKRKLKEWSKSIFGNVHSNAKIVYENLISIQAQI